MRAVVPFAFAGKRSMRGMRKLSVLPVPVCAVARMSRPSRAGGMAAACTGVGVMKFASDNCFCSAGERGSSENSFNLFLYCVALWSIPSKPIVSNHPGDHRGDTAVMFSRQPLAKSRCRPENVQYSMQENRGSADTTLVQDSTYMLCLRLRCARALAAWSGENLQGLNLDFCGPLR